MEERLQLDQAAPGALKGMLELEKYVRSAVKGPLLELIEANANKR